MPPRYYSAAILLLARSAADVDLLARSAADVDASGSLSRHEYGAVLRGLYGNSLPERDVSRSYSEHCDDDGTVSSLAPSSAGLMRAFDTAAENVAPGTAVVGAESKSASAGEGPVAADVVGTASAP